jgi:hypothetical protein
MDQTQAALAQAARSLLAAGEGPESGAMDQAQAALEQAARSLLAADTENFPSASAALVAARDSPTVASSSTAFPRDSLQDETEGEDGGEPAAERKGSEEEEREEEYRYVSPSVAGGTGGRGVESDLLKSSAALQALSVELERRQLTELWVDPTGDSLFEALAQQLYSMPRARAILEAQGYEFVEPPLPVDGLRVWRFVSAALRCRHEVTSYMADPSRFTDTQWQGILPEDRPQYLADLAQPGTAGGAREMVAAAGLFGMEVCCFHVSPKGLSESVIPSPAPRDGAQGGAEGLLGADAGGRIHLVECGGGFWSAVPEGFGSPAAPSPSPRTPSANGAGYEADGVEKQSSPRVAASPGAAAYREDALSPREQDAAGSPAMPRLAPSPPSSREERHREGSGTGTADPALADPDARSQDRGGVKRGGDQGRDGNDEAALDAGQAPATYAEKQWRKLQAKLKNVPSVVSQQFAHGLSKMGPEEPSKATWRRPEQLKYVQSMQGVDDFGRALPLKEGGRQGIDAGTGLQMNAVQGSATGATGSPVAAASRQMPPQVLLCVSRFWRRT